MKKITQFSLVAVLLALPLTQVFAADFNPNKIIDDKVFSDTQTFGSAAGIQQFLSSKKSVLANTDPAFLQQLKEPQDSTLKTNLGDPEPNLGRLRTASELIWDAAQKSGLNPQVIIVTLEKEQGLITNSFSPDREQRALDIAMGFGCPDSGGCDPVYNGFYHQLFGGFDSQGNRYLGASDSLMRSFNTPGGRGPLVDIQNQAFGNPKVRTSKINDTITLDNTQGGPQNPPAQQSVTLDNSATAALYRYTPHVYNGNYNFWKFFDQWFRYPNGSLIKLASDNNYFIIENGLKAPIPNFVITARGLNVANTITVSPTELSSYDTAPIYGPADNTVVKISGDTSGKLYVFENNLKYPASSFVLKQRGISTANILTIQQPEADLFATQTLLAPKDGTLIRGVVDKTVYLIQNGKRMILTGFTFQQYGFRSKDVVTLSDDEVNGYALGTFLLPKDGTLVKIKGSQTVYLLQNGLLQPLSATVFKLRNFKNYNVVTLDGGELVAASMGAFVTPPSGTYFRLSSGAVYQYSNDAKHPVSWFVFKQRRISPVALSDGEADVMPLGSALPPKDGTLIMGDQDGTIYVIQNGYKVPLDYNTWVRKYRRAKPNVLPQSEVDSYLTPDQAQQFSRLLPQQGLS